MVFVVVGAGIGLGITEPINIDAIRAAYPALQIADQITQKQILASLIIGLFPMLIWVWILNQMRHLFEGYKAGNVLTDRSAHLIQRIGSGFLGLAVAQIALVPIQSVLLTWSNPAGERAISVAIHSEMLGFFIAAGLMTLIGWAMRDASNAVTENEAFI
jgi:hypothetical protein